MKAYKSEPSIEIEVANNCPFCGGATDLVHKRVDAWEVKCLKCGASGGVWTSMGKAVDKWNNVKGVNE